jgi:hypothetical protein
MQRRTELERDQKKWLQKAQWRKKMEIRTLIGLHRRDPEEYSYSVEEITKLLREAAELGIDTSVFVKKLPGLKRQELIAGMRRDVRLFRYSPVLFDHFLAKYQEKLDAAANLGIDTAPFEKQIPWMERLYLLWKLEVLIEAKEKKDSILEPEIGQIWAAYEKAKSRGCRVFPYKARILAVQETEEAKALRKAERIKA